jgi:hypothetical protein
MEEKKDAFSILVETPEGRRPPERLRRRREMYIKTGLRYILRWDLEWIHLAQNRDQWRAVCNTVINLLVPGNIGKVLNN